MKSKKSIFKKSISALLLSIVICLFFLQRADKAKNLFSKINGVIISLDKINDNYPGKDSSKFRYLQTDNYPKPFELFIGKDAGDFKPKFENIDNLKLGDSITVYFDESYKTQNKPVNNLVYFIDKGLEPFFIEGNSKKNLIYGIIGFCAIFVLVLLILKKKAIIV